MKWLVTCGSRLLRGLDADMVYREVWEAVGLTDRKLAKALKVLVEDKDAKIRVQAINIVTRRSM